MLSAGTRIYLTNPKKLLSILPGESLARDSMYVLYDVRSSGKTIIPKGTRVLGDWVTDTAPNAQYQAKEIFLLRSSQPFAADSVVIDTTTFYDSNELDGRSIVYQYNRVSNQSTIPRRTITYDNITKPLEDVVANVQYLIIDRTELSMTLTSDFYA